MRERYRVPSFARPVVVVAVVTLAACASGTSGTSNAWARPGMTEEELSNDTIHCLSEARGTFAAARGPRATVDQSRYQRCMQDRGYSASPK
jgi:hypothetical protein